MDSPTARFGKVVTVVGTQWGDEGKGKLIDAFGNDFDLVARYGGGANAGHTIVVGDKKFVFHLVPSAILHENAVCVIGNGCVVDLQKLIDELSALKKAGIETRGRIFVSDRAHLIFPFHQAIDGANEAAKGSAAIGTTKRGIGPAYGDKIARNGIRMAELRDFSAFAVRLRALAEAHEKTHGIEIEIEKLLSLYAEIADEIEPMIVDTSLLLAESIAKGQRILIEGAQGVMLDVDHGTYPFVTSSATAIGGAITGLGIAPKHLNGVVGIAKAYTTRVGAGPFPSEMDEKIGSEIREKGGEFGATTGRPRRCGWFDAAVVRTAVRLCGIDAMNLTKLDVLSGLPEIRIVTGYRLDGEEIFSLPATISEIERLEILEKTVPGWSEPLDGVTSWEALPEAAKQYVIELEALCGAKMAYIGVGPRRDQLIERA